MTIVTEREEMVLKGVQYMDKKGWNPDTTGQPVNSWYIDGHGVPATVQRKDFTSFPELLEWVGRNLADQ